LLLFTNGGACLFDIAHSALWGSEYPVCTPEAQLLFLKVGHVCCIRNIQQYRLSLMEYRQLKLPSSHQPHDLVLRHFSQVVEHPPCSGLEPGTSQTKIRRSNHYPTELFLYTRKSYMGNQAGCQNRNLFY
jgi:hypothetical protein